MATEVTPIRNQQLVTPSPTNLPFPLIRPMDDASEYWRSIFYGSTGVGKTTLCGTASDVESMHDIIMIDLEDGHMSITKRKSIDVISGFKHFAEIARFKEFLTLHCQIRDSGDDERLMKLQNRYMGEQYQDRLRRYRTVIFDSLTTAHRLALYLILGTEIGKSALDDVPDFIDQRDWGRALTMILKLMNEMSSLPMNVLYTAGDQQNEHKVTKRVFTTLQLPGQAAKQVQREVDVVGRLTIVYEGTGDDAKAIRRLRLQPLPGFDAKCRIPDFNDMYVDNWTMTQLMQKLGDARNHA